ncbi:hypothetical protein EUGRSUZ_B02342 [Eucalyptus grandis]|uniref:Uncharacterized protein n=2 Tax=Eucalyptus grandis TaxID=71139 RepID=A0ACC3LUJ1_EUCGR|nr:hypothetical protein EUGRSUZ_B02342 [Eucalyptus grandis]
MSLDGGSFGPSRSLSKGQSPERDSLSPSRDSDSLDPVLKYINQMLMEENMEEQPSVFAGQVALQNTEKSLYDALGQQNLEQSDKSPSQVELSQYIESPASNLSGSSSAHRSRDATNVTLSSSDLADADILYTIGEHSHAVLKNPDQNFLWNVDSNLQFLANSSSSITNYDDGSEESLHGLLVKRIFSTGESMIQFKKGLEEASKFLLTNNQLAINPEDSKPSSETKKGTTRTRIEEEIDMRSSSNGFKGLKNHEREEDAFEEGRANKQTALYTEESELSDLLDKVLLSTENCPTISTSDFRSANELLKQIREDSSPFGDGSQRLAHYFGNGLEARLVGNNIRMNDFFSTIVARTTSTADYLKYYHLNISTCPFVQFSMFFANYMILKFAEKATTLHIIDFGIAFERIEETGCRLKKYCERFDVAFEFNFISSRDWELIKVADLKIQSNETVAVNCLNRFKNLLDETVEDNNPPCEGSERIQRFETYKQWQVRHVRAGFKSLPLDQDFMKLFRGKMKAWYHKDFVLDEDGNWMLQGWRGRIFYGSSCWVPT